MKSWFFTKPDMLTHTCTLGWRRPETRQIKVGTSFPNAFHAIFPSCFLILHASKSLENSRQKGSVTFQQFFALGSQPYLPPSWFWVVGFPPKWLLQTLTDVFYFMLFFAGFLQKFNIGWNSSAAANRGLLAYQVRRKDERTGHSRPG